MVLLCFEKLFSISSIFENSSFPICLYFSKTHFLYLSVFFQEEIGILTFFLFLKPFAQLEDAAILRRLRLSEK